MQAGTVQVNGPIDTSLVTDTTPTHKAWRGIGGYYAVADVAERDAIPTTRRKEGLRVRIPVTGPEWELDADLVTWNVIPTGGDQLTQDQVDSFPVGASGSDQLVKTSELISALTVGNTNFVPELFANSETLGDGTSRTLASLGYSDMEAAGIWTRVNSAFTIDVNTMTIDWICWQEACQFMLQQGAQYMITPGGRGYVFNQTVLLPTDQTAIPIGRRSLRWSYDLRNSRISPNGSGITLLSRYPANQTEATSGYGDYAYNIMNGFFEGDDSSDPLDCALKLGATNHSVLENLEFYKFATSFDLQMCLHLNLRNIKVASYSLYGAKIGDGEWTGSAPNISQGNVVRGDVIRCVNDSIKTPIAGIYLNGMDHATLNQPSFEGSGDPEHLILYNNNLATTTKYCLEINGLRHEEVGASRAAVRFRSNSGLVILRGFSSKIEDISNMPVLLELESIGAVDEFSPLFAQVLASPEGHPGWKFRQNEVQKWDVFNVKLNDMTDFEDATNWDTSIIGSTIPGASYYRYTRPIA